MKRFRLPRLLAILLILTGMAALSAPAHAGASASPGSWRGYCHGGVFFHYRQRWCPAGKYGDGGCYFGEPGLGKNCYKGFICDNVTGKERVLIGPDEKPVCSRQEDLHNKGHGTTPRSCKDHPGVYGGTWCAPGKYGPGQCMTTDTGEPEYDDVCHEGLVCKKYQEVCPSPGGLVPARCYNPKTEYCRLGFVCNKKRHDASPCLPGKYGPGGCRGKNQYCLDGAISLNSRTNAYCPPGIYGGGGWYHYDGAQYCNHGLLCRAGDGELSETREIAAFCRSGKLSPYRWTCKTSDEASEDENCTTRPLVCKGGMTYCPGNYTSCYHPKHQSCHKGGLICGINEKVCVLPGRKPFCYDPDHSPCDKNTAYCAAGEYGDGGVYDIKTQNCGKGLICASNETACKRPGRKAYCHDPRTTRCKRRKENAPDNPDNRAAPDSFRDEQSVNDLLRGR